MPIQIKELIIRATVNENNQSNTSANDSRGLPNGKNEQQERLIRRCVDQVLEILRERNEP